MDIAEKWKELFAIRIAYQELIALRIREVNLPDSEKTLKNEEFLDEEDTLNKRGTNIRENLGILAISEALICVECVEKMKNKRSNQSPIFPYRQNKETVNLIAYKKCSQHAGQDPIIL